MALVESNWNPTSRQLRQFGALSVLALPCMAWLASANPPMIGLTALVGSLIAIVSWMAPKAIAPLFLACMILAMPIGFLVGELALLLLFGLLFVPMAIAFRLLGRNRLQLRLDRSSTSYWQTKERPKHVSSYFRQS